MEILIIVALAAIVIMVHNQKQEISKLNESFFRSMNKLYAIEELLKNLKEKSFVESEKEAPITPTIEPDISIIEQIEEILVEPIEEEQSIENILTDVNEIEVISETIEEPYVVSSSQSNLEPTPVQSESYSNTSSTPEKEPTLSAWFRKFRQENPDIEKFIGENLINKIGILILILGISFFVKYAIDKEWINEPGRVGIGIFAGALILGVAHKLREKFIAFSSVLVAGAVSVFYFTIGIAFHDYHLFSQTTAFLIMVFITIFAVFVSIIYNRQELGVLSTIAGFAVPFMVSTGDGNYLVLLSYLSILNIGILSISYYKRWFIVNFTALLATLLIVGSWYVLWTEPTSQMLGIAFGFCTLFYIIFITAFSLNNVIHKNKFQNYEIAAALLATVLYYAIGYNITFNISPYYLGLFTLLLGMTNMLIAYVIYKNYKYDKNIIYIFIGLALTLATITIPIQLDGNYITVLWASEAVLLFWLSRKSNMPGFTLSAIIVQALAFCSAIINLEAYGETYLVLSSITISSQFLTNLFFIASLIMTYRMVRNENLFIKIFKETFAVTNYHKVIFYLALILGYIFPIVEIVYQCNAYSVENTTLFFWVYFYHMVYTTSILLYNMKYSSKISVPIIAMLSFNIVLYMLWGYHFPIQEIINNLVYETTGSVVFYVHYFTLGLLIYQSWILFKETFLADEKHRDIKSVFPWGFALFFTYLLSTEINILFLFNTNSIENYQMVRLQVIKVVYPILWGVLAFAFLIYGVKRNLKPVRIIALALLGITILKLFTYDIKDVSETGKIIAFILLGVLILTISFVYQKIKKLVVDNNEK